MVKVYVAIAVICLTALLSSSSFGASTSCHAPTTYQLYTKLPREYPKFYHALKRLWGSHWVEAAKVSWAEGSWHLWAKNGQYLGTFQCGDFCRGKYGTGIDLVGQAVAAHKYYLDSGWGPWECRYIL